MKAYWGVEIQLHAFFDLGTRWSWRRLQNEKLHNLYASLNIIRAIKQRRVRQAGHVARMGDAKYKSKY
jgi:hypothetical protein